MKRFKVFVLCIILILCFSSIASAKDNSKNEIDSIKLVSPEFENAYIEQEIIDLKGVEFELSNGEVSIKQTDKESNEIDKIMKKFKKIEDENPELYSDILDSIASGKEIAGIVTAEVYVDEVFREEDGNLSCISSRLLDKDEVKKLDKTKIGKMELVDSVVETQSYTIVREYESKGRLTIDFMIGFDDSYNGGNGIEYELDANANWDDYSFLYSSKYDPAVGEDFFGFAWGGDFNYRYASASASNNTGGTVSVNKAKVSPQMGYVWSFDELVLNSNPYYIYADHVDAEIELYKNYLTGQGNSTSFVFEYIHTYQSSVGSIGFNASGPSFSLSSTSKSWSIVTEQTNNVFLY